MLKLFKQNLHVMTVCALFAVIAGGYLMMAWSYPVAYILATYEDLYGEWAQTWSYLLACLLFVLLALRQSSYRWFFILLSAACLYVFLEEISWGQRLIGFDTPPLLKRYNLQQEANIHNLLVGPISTTTKAVIEYVLAAALFLYGLVFPLMLRWHWQPAVWFDRMGIASPPLYLWPFFVLAAFLELGPFGFNEAEVAEMLVATSLAIMGLHYNVFIVRKPASRDTEAGLLRSTAGFSLLLLFLIGTVAMLSAVTTWHLLDDEDVWPGIDARIQNGYEKFAGRYAGYSRWETAIFLLERVHQREPQRTSVLRRLAKLARESGEDDEFKRYTQMALDIDIKVYAENPDKRSTNLSLARTFQLGGENERAHFHANRAVDLALQHFGENPESANNVYWVAKTMHFQGNYEAALANYQRAFELKPASSKYRRAYYKMRAIYEDQAEVSERESLP